MTTSSNQQDSQYFRAVVSSDWHLTGMKKVLGAGDSVVQLKEIEKVYQYAVLHGIEHLFVPGDLFDSPDGVSQDENVLLHLLMLVLKYRNSVKTHYIAGNHDFSETSRTSLDMIKAFSDAGLLPGLFVYDKVTVIDNLAPFPIRMLPYPCLTVPENLINNDLGHLNFCHVEYEGAMGDNGYVFGKSKHSTKYKHGKLDFTISGHIHKHQVLPKIPLMYVGSLYQTSFAETPVKGFVDIIVRHNDDQRICLKKKFVRVHSSWTLCDLNVDSTTDFNTLSDTLLKNQQVKYRLCVDNKNESVYLPSDFTSKHANIVSIKGKHKKDLSEYASLLSQHDYSDKTDSDSQAPVKIDAMYGLSSYLSSCGHNDSEIKKARRMVRQALKSLKQHQSEE